MKKLELHLSTSGLDVHGLSGNHTCIEWVMKMRLEEVMVVTYA
jgi:hypothetical protein